MATRRSISRWLDRRYGPRSGEPCSALTNNCQFWFDGAQHLRPPCCTSHLMELARFVHELLSRDQVPFWLDYGTLLGAARDGRLIAWDDDIDMGFFAEDVGRIRALSAEIAGAGFVLDATDPYVVRVQYSRVNYLHVDLYPHSVEGDFLRMDFYDGLEWPGVEQYRVPRRYFDKLAEVSLEGEVFPAPSPLEEFIEQHRFGPGWRTPARKLLLPWRIPRVGPGDVNPTVSRLLEALADKQAQLLCLQARPLGRIGHENLWQLWQEAGRPASPDSRRVEALSEQVPSEDDTPLVRELLVALAALGQSIEEIEAGFSSKMLVRIGRRLRRLPALLSRELRRSPGGRAGPGARPGGGVGAGAGAGAEEHAASP